MSVLPAWSVHHIYAWCLWRSEDGVRSPWTGITGSYEPHCRWWELNLNPLKEESIFLIADPSLWPQKFSMCLLAVALYTHTIWRFCSYNTWFKSGTFGHQIDKGRRVTVNLSCHFQWIWSFLDLSVRLFTPRADDTPWTWVATLYGLRVQTE